MNRTKGFKQRFQKNFANSKGLTLVELLAVLAIMGLVAGIAIPSVHSTLAKAKVDICELNATQLEKMYESHLIANDLEHTDQLFVTFMKANLDDSTEDYRYFDGEVQCTIHPKDNTEKEGEVPYL